ncbi:uncharacterized protein LOC124163576 isoform X2 [Ischnura elegans]|uniref:uncharacterized protein LOC124163576 isoform X2 n=1 Tax=Ischnura elegans TaxID=197161 RepID=UPI001ED89D2E|nr:uncharacterized protein LOC124163576 isoform X2 [Ischnura elegans]
MEVAGNWNVQPATLVQVNADVWALQQKYSVCRLCLCHGGLFDIFDSCTEMDIELKETIENLLQCPVEREEGFPWLVCHPCERKLTEFRLFKRRCLECKQAFDIRFKCYKPVVIAPQNVIPTPMEVNLPTVNVNMEQIQVRGRGMEESSQTCVFVDQNVKVKQMKAMGEEMEESSQLCHIADVGQLNLNQFESGVIDSQQPMVVNRIGIAPMTEVGGERQPDPEEYKASAATEGGAPFIESYGKQDVKQEPVDWDEVPRLNGIRMESVAELEYVSKPEYNTSAATEVGAPLIESYGNQDIDQESVGWDEAPQMDCAQTEPLPEEENSFGSSEEETYMAENMNNADGAPDPYFVVETSYADSTDVDANMAADPNMIGVTDAAVAAKIPIPIAQDLGQGLDSGHLIMPASLADQADTNHVQLPWKPVLRTKIRVSENFQKGGTFCCVNNCRNSVYTPGIQYVKLPKNVELARELLASIGQLHLLPNDLSHLMSRIICMDHFAPPVVCGETNRLIFGPLRSDILVSGSGHQSRSTDQTALNMRIDSPASHTGKRSSSVRLNVLRKKSSMSPSATSPAPSPIPDNCAPLTITLDDKTADAGAATTKPRVKAPRKQALTSRTYMPTNGSREPTPPPLSPSPPPSQPQSEPRKPRVRKISCFVPMCPNKELKRSKKYFVSVPKDERRMVWLQAAHYPDLQKIGNLFCCEDHFEMREGFSKYSYSKSYAGVRFLIPKPNTVPKYFDCQVGRTRVHNPRLRQMGSSVRSYKELSFSDDDSSSSECSSESSSPANSPAPSPVPQPADEAEKDDQVTENASDVTNSETQPSSLPGNPDSTDAKDDESAHDKSKVKNEDNDCRAHFQQKAPLLQLLRHKFEKIWNGNNSNGCNEGTSSQLGQPFQPEFSRGSNSKPLRTHSRRKQTFNFSSRIELVCDVDN